MAAAIIFAGFTLAKAQEKVVFGTQRSLIQMVISVGIKNGFFRQEGLDVSTVFGKRGTDTIAAAIAGQIQFGFSGLPPFLAATSKGAKLVAVGVFSHGYSGHLVASNANAGLRTLPEFRGKRIGMQRGTGVATVFQIAIRRLGLKEDDFNINNLRVNDMPTAMHGGSFDAVLGWEPNMSRIVALGYGVKAIAPKSFEKIAGVTYVFPLFTTLEMAKQNPGVVQKFMNAFAKAQNFAHKRRPESLRILRNSLGDVVKHLSDAELESLAYVYQKDRVAFTDADMKDFDIMGAFMLQSGRLKTMPDVSVRIDNSFALKAQQVLTTGK